MKEVSDEEVRFENYGIWSRVSFNHGNVSYSTVELFERRYPSRGGKYVEGVDYEIDETTGEIWALSGGGINLDEACFLNYYYDERYTSEAMDANPYVISSGEWHRLWFSVKPGEMRLRYDGNKIYSGGWAPSRRTQV